MKSNCERELIEQLERVYSFRRDTDLNLSKKEDCETFLEENNVIERILYEREHLNKDLIFEKYQTKLILDTHLIEETIVKHLGLNIFVRCNKSDITREVRTGRRVTRGMGLGEEDEYIFEKIAERICIEIDFNRKKVFNIKPLNPQFITIQKSQFNENIRKIIYSLISEELSYIILTDFKDDSRGINKKYNLFKVLSITEEQCNTKIIKIQMRIFSTIDNETITMLEEFEDKTYTNFDYSIIQPLEVITPISISQITKGATIEHYFTHTFRVTAIKKTKKDFLNIILEEVIVEEKSFLNEKREDKFLPLPY